MALDPRYIPLFHLQQDFLDKTTGLQLQGGVVYSWQDNNRNNLKPLYQLAGAPPNYSYVALPNPVTLTNAGTFSDGANNDIVAYAFPYDANGDPDNYFIQVYAQPSVPPVPPQGTPILTREAVPGVISSSGPAAVGPSSTSNELVNSQFVDVLFDTAQGMSIAYSNGMTEVQFAPGWYVKVNATGAGTVSVNRTALPGSANNATNPPYSITVDPNGGANMASLFVFQRLDNNPNIYANEWLSAGIALRNPSQTVSMYYAPQGTAVAPALLTASNATGTWQFYSNTNLNPLNPGGNTATADTGYVDIQIQLPTTGPTTFSSVQLIGLSTYVVNLPYDQQPAIQQKNSTFFYYNDLLAAKPIPSYLVGWDFPLNPAQPLGEAVAVQAIGAGKSFYAWDQTIVFQEANSGVSVSRDTTTKALKLTAQQAGKLAIVQYLGEAQAREILSGRASVYLSGLTNQAGGYRGTISLWASAVALPDMKSPNYLSLVSALGVDGKAVAGNGTWTEVPRTNFGDAIFELSTTSTEHMFNGWALNGAAPQTTATFFAIVVGFESITALDSISLSAVGLYAGDIATRPAPKTEAETLLDCQETFYKTFAKGTAPANAVGFKTGEYSYTTTLAGASTVYAPSLSWPTTMRATPVVTYYNPVLNNSNVRDESGAGGDCSATANWGLTSKYLVFSVTGFAGSSVGNLFGVHITADARFGIV